MINDYWQNEDLLRLGEAASFADLAQVGIAVAERVALDVKKRRRVLSRVCQVCGPISTGGFGSFEKNVVVFRVAFRTLSLRGFTVFNQMPLQDAIVRLHQRWKKKNGDGYCWPILHDVYEPLFRSGHIAQGCFLSNWHTSEGARWEKSRMMALGIAIFYIPEEWVLSRVSAKL